MYKTLSLLLFLGMYLTTSCQNIELYFGTSYPARPVGGIVSVQHLITSQLIYPATELQDKVSAEVFIKVEVDWEGNLKIFSSSLDSSDSFNKEAIRLIKLIRWETDKIRKGKNISPQQIKIEFNPKKYSRLTKKRETNPILSKDNNCYALSQLTDVPKIKNAKNIGQLISENFKYPALALQQGISGKVTVHFIIESNGKASNFEITTPLAGGCNEETIRLLKLATWNAGTKGTTAVRTNFKYTLNFNHPGNTYR